MGLCFAIFVFLTFRGPLASHDSNPYPNRSRIARYNATKVLRRVPRRFWEGFWGGVLRRVLGRGSQKEKGTCSGFFTIEGAALRRGVSRRRTSAIFGAPDLFRFVPISSD